MQGFINNDNLRKTFPVCLIPSILNTQRRTVIAKNKNEEIEGSYVKKFMNILGLTDALKTVSKIMYYFNMLKYDNLNNNKLT